MKKLSFVLFVYFFGSILTCCTTDRIITYETIESVSVSLHSFDENGAFLNLNEFNPNDLRIRISADSTSVRKEIAQHISNMDKAYAMSNPNEHYFTNTIDSLNVYTVYDFDSDHPAGSNVNDIFLYLDGIWGNTYTSEININETSSTMHMYKFSTVPQNDSIQFEITGRITNKGNFSKRTELVIFD